MKYVSTRGLEEGLSFEDVLFVGYAKDGGLYLPERIPQISPEERNAWSRLSYPDLAKEILTKFISEDEIPRDDLNEIVDKAVERFLNKNEKDPSSSEDVIRFASLSNGLNVAELFHGPTLAFKDLSLGVVGQLINYFLEKRQKHMTILIGTSGDTGSSAIWAVRGLKWVDIVVLLPKGRCTQIQELQMTTVLDDNVHNFAVEGSSDDLDKPIKSILSDEEFSATHHLCSLNSINWGRILMQTVHFVFSYFFAKNGNENCEQVEIAVPTGAAGNITAGFVCREMGFPIRLVACVNPNDIVHKTFSVGSYRQFSNDVTPTWSPAMDILVPYNVERILLLASNYDFRAVAKIMKDFETDPKVGAKIPEDLLEIIRLVIVDTISVRDEEIISTIQRCYKENQYLICPHTATAVKYHYSTPRDMVRVCIATAAPHKFPEALTAADVPYVLPEKISRIFDLPTRFEWMRKGEDWEEILRLKIVQISGKTKA